MNPNITEEEVLEELVEFYNKISVEFVPLEISDKPNTYDVDMPVISEHQISVMIRKMKKSKSMVPGDIPPCLINSVAKACAGPLTSIFNAMPMTGWPSLWGKEYQTIIPKKPSPDSANDCRNLACTNYFSKVLESFVLESLHNEIEMTEKQFGGIKGSGVNHLLIYMWDRLLEGLEEDHSAATLMVVDFSKAFNRMQHQACLRALAKKGCSRTTLRMIFFFLSKQAFGSLPVWLTSEKK